MKTWTVVIEIKSEDYTDRSTVDFVVSEAMKNRFIGFQIFEVTEASYGPNGMSLVENKIGRAGRVRTAPISTCEKSCKPLGGGK